MPKLFFNLEFHMFRPFLIFTLLLISFIISGYSMEDRRFDLSDLIREHQPDSIEFYHDDRVFLKTDHISVTPQGLFLVSETSMIHLPNLNSCNEGCFIQSGEESTTLASVYVPITCGNCGFKYWYSPAQSRCPNCGHSGN